MAISLSNYFIKKSIYIFVIVLAFLSCTKQETYNDVSSACFDKNNIVKLGFVNKIQSDTLSVVDYHYLYNGGGVGIADFDGDGYKDIVLGGNLVSSVLYSGGADLKFKDVTSQAGLITKDWVNGVALVDVNNDGKKDIYFSVGGPLCQEKPCSNLLYINKSEKGIFEFVESAADYGLDIEGYSQQGLFFDADLDGDLDLYQLQNYVDHKSKNYPQPKRYFSKKSFDRFYENQYDETGKHAFVDRSSEWNVNLPGFGLGIAMSDFNRDGYPDLYIANDFITDDILYINQAGKKFVDRSKDLLKHTTYNSMGVDIGDVNDDARQDVMVVDMLPYDNERQKTMLGMMNYNKYLLSQKSGYNRQFIRNTVQLNNGLLDTALTAFSDVGTLYNVHQTDWSWSPLIMDFDNDGDTDIYVSNGYGKNITDLDFVNYSANLVGFGSQESMQKRIKTDVDALPEVMLPNHLFVKNEQGVFENHIDFPKTITNGVAYGDLDNDGDLDLVQNNINDNATILVNNSNDKSANDFVKIKLNGSLQNLDAIGSCINVFLNTGKVIYRDVAPVRSYLSTMSDELVVGFGSAEVDSILVKWFDGKITRLQNVPKNQLLEFDYNDALEIATNSIAAPTLLTQKKLLEAKDFRILKKHDFSRQPFLLKSCFNQQIVLEKSKKSNLVYVANLKADLCLLNPDDLSNANNNINDDTNSDVQSIFALPDFLVTDMKTFVLDDKEQILLVGYEEQTNESRMMRLFEKNGQWTVHSMCQLLAGSYQIELGELEESKDSGVVYLAHYPSPEDYPTNIAQPIQKIVLTDDGLVKKEMAISDKLVCPTSVAVLDIDGDDKHDVVAIGEWMSPYISKTDGTEIAHCQSALLDSLKGLWQNIHCVDLDNDGDKDLVLANIGNNTRYKMGYDAPLELVADDLDGNGQMDPLLSIFDFQNGKKYCYHSRDDIASQLPKLKKTYGNYSTFAKADFEEVLLSFKKDVGILSASISESVVLENLGNCQFKLHLLPKMVQQSIVNNFGSRDLNGDGLLDIIALTNNFDVETHNGCIDGLNALVVLNEGDFNFRALSIDESGLYVKEASKDIVHLDAGFLVAGSSAIYYLELVNEPL